MTVGEMIYSIVKLQLMLCKSQIIKLHKLFEHRIIPINLISSADAYIDVSNGWLSLAQSTIPRAVKLVSGNFHVKSLILSKDALETLSRAENLLWRLPTFHNLTHIGVDQGMYDFTGEALVDILEKSPNLEVLDIVDGFDPDFCSDGEAWTLRSVPRCLKSSLKLASISDFRGGEAEMQFLSFLLKNAVDLTRIKIFCEDCLSADLKKQADINSQLQVKRKGLASCAIELR
ncbi:putative FBD-associated F-box protein At5g50270 [Neltuma alba]|uniref:putative FBD-associated F-box protein At5g50270 n=1 Tax=Neltuma alba TaxID=207710 RepID=UPI0010A42650|nr:putative FBD-associated F-box protein At5g50270 [Prosopis alba]